MCEHHHHHHDEKPPLIVIAAIIVFAAAIIFFPGNAVLYIIAYILAGGEILTKAFKNICHGEIFDENFLMTIATVGAIAIREYPEAVMVMVLYRIGEYFQHKAVHKTRTSISQLMDIRPEYANIEENGKISQKSPEEVKIGDVIIISPGEKIPLDGIVISGKATVDTSALTGESVPREIHTGDSAISGCINIDGVIKIEVTKEYKDSTVSRILELIEHAGHKKAKTEKFITKFAKYYTPVVVFSAIFLAILPPLITGAPFSIWLERALTFLVISCPCALVISVPLGFFAGIGGASKVGILIKGSTYIETLSKPYAIAFDKTGTLTKGSFKVKEDTDENLLKITALAEKYSNHPIALSIKTACKSNINDIPVMNVTELAGLGVEAEVNGDNILVGNYELMLKRHIDCPKAEEFGTIVYTAKNNKYLGYIVISDEIKEDTAPTINGLKQKNILTVMLTGDTKHNAEITAQTISVDEVYSELLPQDKVQKIEELISKKPKNKSVIFAGDGINDAPVLAIADTGIAMGALGSDAAIEAADIVITDDKPSKILLAINIAQKTMNIVKQNIVFALGIKFLFLLLGAIGFMTMWGAVFADVGVTLIAILNSLKALKVEEV